jgi:hypothetical protein
MLEDPQAPAIATDAPALAAEPDPAAAGSGGRPVQQAAVMPPDIQATRLAEPKQKRVMKKRNLKKVRARRLAQQRQKQQRQQQQQQQQQEQQPWGSFNQFSRQ